MTRKPEKLWQKHTSRCPTITGGLILDPGYGSCQTYSRARYMSFASIYQHNSRKLWPAPRRVQIQLLLGHPSRFPSQSLSTLSIQPYILLIFPTICLYLHDGMYQILSCPSMTGRWTLSVYNNSKVSCVMLNTNIFSPMFMLPTIQCNRFHYYPQVVSETQTQRLNYFSEG